MSSLSQALHLDYLPSSHSAFQDHAAHNAGWSACLDPTAHGVPVNPRVLPHSSIMLHGARFVRDTCNGVSQQEASRKVHLLGQFIGTVLGLENQWILSVASQNLFRTPDQLTT